MVTIRKSSIYITWELSKNLNKYLSFSAESRGSESALMRVAAYNSGLLTLDLDTWERPPILRFLKRIIVSKIYYKQNVYEITNDLQIYGRRNGYHLIWIYYKSLTFK